MLNMILSGGYTSESGELKPIHEVNNPSENLLLECLELVRESYGALTIEREDGEQSGPQQLEVYTEYGRYMLLLGVIDDSGNYDVKTMYYPNSSGLENMHGEPYPASAICTDFAPIIAACKEFLNTGDVVGVPLDY